MSSFLKNSVIALTHKGLVSLGIILCTACSPELNRDIENSSAGSSDQNSALSVVSFDQATYTTSEGSGTLSVTLNRTNTSSSAIVVTIDVAGSSTASSGVHYSIPETVSFSSGSSQATLDLTLVDNGTDANNTNLLIRIANSSAYRKGDIEETSITIVDNDPEVIAVASSEEFSCVLSSSNGYCWGSNNWGMLGNNDSDQKASSSPTALDSVTTGLTDIDVGGRHGCLVDNGAAKCWGEGLTGSIGDGSSTHRDTPTQVSGLTTGVTSVSAGGGYKFNTGYSCAVVSNAAYCWGSNSGGELGDNSTTDRPSPVQVDGLTTNVTNISAGDHQTTCAVVNGGAKCWGKNDSGQLGDSTTTDRTAPVDVTGLGSGSDVTQVAVGLHHACAIQDGAVLCWGDNTYGQLGDASNTNSTTPVSVSGLSSGVTSIDAGNYHTCAVHSGAVKCWGINASTRALGNQSTQNSNTPVSVKHLVSSVTKLASGPRGNCAVMGGAAFCWGSNRLATDGTGRSIIASTPVAISGLGSSIDSFALGRAQNCRIQSGALACRGHNFYGQLGAGNRNNFTSYSEISGLDSLVTTVSFGLHATCAAHNGEAKCWGDNANGVLGQTESALSVALTPTTVPGLTTGVTSFSISDFHTCAIQSGAALCWGNGEAGRLGNGVSTATVTAPTTVTGMGTGVTEISSAFGHVCAIKDNGAWCWGRGSQGRLGNGSTSNQSTPVQPTGLNSGVQKVCVGLNFSCAVHSGAAKCWGDNEYGQLGDGTTTDSSSPVQVSGLTSNITDVACMRKSACAIDNGQVRCWGKADAGQLGNGTVSSSPSTTPQLVSGIDGINEIATEFYDGTGNDTVCVEIDNGEQAFCWGQITDGSITGAGVFQNVPAAINL